MKDTFTSLLTLVIMIIGLALIIGGPGAVRFLFAPFVSGIRLVVRVCFVALIVLVLLAAAMSGKRLAPKPAQVTAETTSQSAVEHIATPAASKEVRDGH